MSSLRTRVLASVLALAAAGLLILAAVTYAEQRSFLQGRLDEEVRAAGPAVSQALDNAGFSPGAQDGYGGGAPAGEPNAAARPPSGGPGGGPGRRRPNVNLPPGTYGQRRSVRAPSSGTS